MFNKVRKDTEMKDIIYGFGVNHEHLDTLIDLLNYKIDSHVLGVDELEKKELDKHVYLRNSFLALRSKASSRCLKHQVPYYWFCQDGREDKRK